MCAPYLVGMKSSDNGKLKKNILHSILTPNYFQNDYSFANHNFLAIKMQRHKNEKKNKQQYCLHSERIIFQLKVFAGLNFTTDIFHWLFCILCSELCFDVVSIRSSRIHRTFYSQTRSYNHPNRFTFMDVIFVNILTLYAFGHTYNHTKCTCAHIHIAVDKPTENMKSHICGSGGGGGGGGGNVIHHTSHRAHADNQLTFKLYTTHYTQNQLRVGVFFSLFCLKNTNVADSFGHKMNHIIVAPTKHHRCV